MSTAVAEAPGLNLGRAFKWMFASPNWLTNLFWVFLCALLGSVLIGNFVLIGYQLDIVQRRSRGGENTDVDFDANRFAEYLIRGLIPFAIYLVISVVLGAVSGLVIVIWGAVMSMVLGPHPEDAMALLMGLPIFGVIFVHVLAICIFALPLALRAGLCNELNEGFKIGWAWETAKFMWPHALLFLLYVIVGSFVSMFGIVLCFVGLFVTSAWLQLVVADLGAQLYDIYLWKGGQPIAMHGETLTAEVI